MGTRDDQKQRTREQILDSAARLLRERGISRASVAEVMAGAGLTVGGFYAHFDSKEALMGASLRRCIQQLWGALIAEAGPGKGAEALLPVLKRYLSRAHRDHPEQGCPIPAVLGDAAHGNVPVREVLEEQVTSAAEAMSAYLDGTPAKRRQRALATLALMYGGLSLARGLGATPLSDEVLKACVEYARTALRDD